MEINSYVDRLGDIEYATQNAVYLLSAVADKYLDFMDVDYGARDEGGKMRVYELCRTYPTFKALAKMAHDEIFCAHRDLDAMIDELLSIGSEDNKAPSDEGA